jgi:predicted  nucleic acid-binding Zn-ribbon protein
MNVLVARCAAQEDKLNECKGARLLEKELNALKKMREKEKSDHDREIQSLMGDLQQVGNEKQALQDEISTLRTNNHILQQDLDGNKHENQQRRDKINQLYDELKEMQECKERESTECMALRKNLQDIRNDVFNRDTEIEDLKIKHNNKISILRRKLVDQKQSDEQSIAEISNAKEEAICNVRREIDMKQLELDQRVA